MSADYSRMTPEAFRAALEAILGEMSAGELLAIPGVWEVVAEALNNEILDRWAEDHPVLAYGSARGPVD